MDTTSIIIGLFFVALFIVPIWLIQRSQNKSKGTLSKSFKQAASTQGLSISTSDFWANMYGIGVDEKSNKLLYLAHKPAGEKVMVVDLNTLEKCSIERKTHQSGNGKHQETVTDRLDLKLIHNDAMHTTYRLEFYEESTSLHMNGEQILLEKWQKIIGNKLAVAKT
ncbi:MAG: hypothetical protein IH597_13760 [Bacteroidales bacterium]|nr:hypothetical protein [Bacteroidales bacterium]